MNQIAILQEYISELKEQLFQEQWEKSNLNAKCNALMHDIEQLQRAKQKAERYEEAIKEALELMKHGGHGTRSKVWNVLEKAWGE
ncbi:hypothetical protein P9850_01800 [Anoxybacillus rupiensis]|uniref:Uncharacterized protein n=1 Tax=Anoxybacteroides rupiense TaxID=311460 RepID=A0ABD5IQY3_9BACL|nr:hypothetical protein [Anoxybacillus rupiensis]